MFEPQRALPPMTGCSIACQLMTMLMLRGTVRFDPRPLLFVGGAAGVALAIPGLGWIEPRTSRGAGRRVRHTGRDSFDLVRAARLQQG